MTDQYPNRVVWAEIPVTDMARAKAFYEALFMAPLKDNDMGPFPTAIFPYPEGIGASGQIQEGKPAVSGTGIRVHVAVFDELEAAMARVKKAGGEVSSDIITIPAGQFFYANDCDGNPLGVFRI